MKRWNVILASALIISNAAKAADTYNEATPAEDVAKTERKAAPAKKYPVKPNEPEPSNPVAQEREPASFGRMEETMSKPKADWNLRLDLSTGLSSLGSNNAKDRTARDNSNIDRNIYFGLNSDFQWGQYLGANLDLHTSLGSSSTAPVVDQVSGAIDNRSRKLSQSGGTLDLQARYTLDHWGRLWNWRAGVGYGILSVSQTNPPVSTSVTDSKLKVSAPYLVGGLEIRVIPHVSINGDAAVSFGGSATGSETTAAGTTDTALSSPRWVRLRLSAAYELSKAYLLGVQYIRREIRGTAPLGTGQTAEGSHQFLTMFSVLL